MLQKFFSSKADSFKVLFKILMLVLLCLATVGIFMCIAAFVITQTDFSYDVLVPVTTVILALSALIDSFIVSRSLKENGLVVGVIIGVIILSFVVITSLCTKQFKLSTPFFTKTLAILISGAIGGIIGVNTN